MVMLRGTKIWDYHAAVCRGQAKLSEILKAFSTSKQQEKEDKWLRQFPPVPCTPGMGGN